MAGHLDFLETKLTRKAMASFQSKHQAKADAMTVAVQGIVSEQAKKRAAATTRLREERLAKEAADPAWLAERDARAKAAKRQR